MAGVFSDGGSTINVMVEMSLNVDGKNLDYQTYLGKYIPAHHKKSSTENEDAPLLLAPFN